MYTKISKRASGMIRKAIGRGCFMATTVDKQNPFDELYESIGGGGQTTPPSSKTERWCGVGNAALCLENCSDILICKIKMKYRISIVRIRSMLS